MSGSVRVKKMLVPETLLVDVGKLVIALTNYELEKDARELLESIVQQLGAKTEAIQRRDEYAIQKGYKGRD